ncbi:transketolase [Dethiosulfovibrio salsuginis]|uniref:Transketolase n=1 Tax=Dethiosulfovibrio salsuginis TaxID=561720 RepID=A0A1X7JHR8_9BACT|nr:transketolase [Dethiosulfovibrio salsuginis]SMG27083.1 transketolase [Dethiosulfovibrio salsuginis]
MKDLILTDKKKMELEEAVKRCSSWAVSMVARANSGHPAGSLSSMWLYLAAYDVADITPKNCDQTDRDYVVISHGHTSPGAYAALAYYGFVDPMEAIADFRRCGSAFQGHVERAIPGIDWGSGNLGQGLSAAVGYALALKKRGLDRQVYVLMGDGEQPKGQVAEARRIALSQGLKNITVMVDYNHIQISGRVERILPVNIKALWEADGWAVLEADGHDFASIYDGMAKARAMDVPVVLLCHTVMGKGVSFMEDKPDYHGKAATGDLYKQAMDELGQPDWLEAAAKLGDRAPHTGRHVSVERANLELGIPKTYPVDKKTDNRSGFGNALADVGSLNLGVAGKTPVLVFDCDLAGSVKTAQFAKECPGWFVQCGIQEHSTATVAGAAGCCSVVPVWADFGVFGLAEAYNQQRLNDINGSNLKLVLTHVGLDVGEDGMTHQCIDYVSLLSNSFGWKLIVPVDPNQTDRVTRWALKEPGNICLAMGRSTMYPLSGQDGEPLFASLPFTYGKAHKVGEGEDCTILAMGAMTSAALEARAILEREGKKVKVYAVSCPLEVDMEALDEAVSTGYVVTLEDHCYRTGMGSLWARAAAEAGLCAKWSFMGVHRYGDSGPSDQVYDAMGLSPLAVADRIKKLLP